MTIEQWIIALTEQGEPFLCLTPCRGGERTGLTERPLGAFERVLLDPEQPRYRLLAPDPPRATDAPCKTLLVEGHALSTSPLALLNAAFDALEPGATLLLALAPGPNARPAAPEVFQRHLGYLIALARRCGFLIAERSETTTAPDAPLRHASPPPPQPSPAEGGGSEFDQGVGVSPSPGGRGPGGGGLNGYPLRFIRDARPPRWRIDLALETDLAEFSTLFERTFGTEISQCLWSWKYGDGRGHGVIARRDGTIVAHYGSTRRRGLFRDRPITALQMCDVMVDPRERAVMTKQGAFFLTTASLLELYLGLGAIDLPFGFPNARAARIGERLGLYAEVGRIMEVRWPASSDQPRLGTRVRALDPNEPRDRALVERLWSAMRQDLREAILVVRDWDYLTYRYLAHPEHRYEALLVSSRLTARPLGLMVLRRAEQAVELLDLVGPLANIPALIDQARRLTALWRLESVFCWITQQHLPRFMTPGAEVKDPDVIVPTNVWVEGPGVETLRDRWWLMSGDTEFR